MARISQQNFYLLQIGLGALFLGLAWIFLRPKTPESRFRVREADRPQAPGARGSQDLANAKMKRHEPLALPGIRVDGAAHEILGISPNASAGEVQRAYRELMKRYHPDRVGRPGSREWQDAQKIAEALNRAKDEMLKRVR